MFMFYFGLCILLGIPLWAIASCISDAPPGARFRASIPWAAVYALFIIGVCAALAYIPAPPGVTIEDIAGVVNLFWRFLGG